MAPLSPHELTDLGRERFQALPKAAGLSDITNKDEVAAVLRRHILHARDR